MPQPNTRGIGPLVGRTSGNRRSIMHISALILNKNCNFFFEYISDIFKKNKNTSSGKELTLIKTCLPGQLRVIVVASLPTKPSRDITLKIPIGVIYSSRTIYLPSLKFLGQSVLEFSVAQGEVDWHDL